jgi:hypothetical protein
MNNSADLPPFGVIAKALRVTTERLVREVVDPCDTAPDWSEFEWTVARAVSAMQGISGLLAVRLKWRGPVAWNDFLCEQHAQMSAREPRIDRLLMQLDVACRKAGLPYVALKGSAVRAIGLHRRGERPQSDVDLLVAPADLEACGRIVESIGLRYSFADRHHTVYSPPEDVKPGIFGEHADNPLRVEVHGHVSEPLPIEPVDITAAIWPQTRSPGNNGYSRIAALFQHLCLHAATNMRANAARFVQIYEIAMLARRMQNSDWRDLRLEDASLGKFWWMYPAMALASRYVPESIPRQLLAELCRACPARLSERYDDVAIWEVSWSNLRIAALPGHEWSRSFAEVLRLVRSRVLPKRDELAELSLAARSEPRIMQVRWYGASHVERIARWVLSRPPRVQTIVAIRDALNAGSQS